MICAEKPSQLLFVAWHDSRARGFHTVGRLVRFYEAGGPKYEFTYVRGASLACERGFKPFLAFPHLDQVYRSDEVFPFFANRLLSPGRPDYADYVRRLGLNPQSANEMTILGRSGGVRATDSLVLFPLPRQEPSVGCYQTYFLAYDTADSVSEQIARFPKGKPLLLEWHQQRGIGLHTYDHTLIGHLPSYLLGDALRLANLCSYLEVAVEQVNPPPAPLQQRLLCRLRSCWPEGFVPFSDPIFQPLPPEAHDVSRPALTATTGIRPDRLFATIIEKNESRVIPLPYRGGTWTGDGIQVLANQVFFEDKSYPIVSRKPFYADFSHGDRRIVITE